MKNILYFIVGLIYLPIMALVMTVKFITNTGDTLIDNVRFAIRWHGKLESNKEAE